MDKMQSFCTHIRAALACYEDMPPEQQQLARLFASKKLESLNLIQTAAGGPGGELAGELLQKMQRLEDYK